ncbi:MAG: hypothetical protein MUE30_15155 [Spirosomaceae bacterium]|nr:hypothetical protein [Spirosomataceae bacterium]
MRIFSNTPKWSNGAVALIYRSDLVKQKVIAATNPDEQQQWQHPPVPPPTLGGSRFDLRFDVFPSRWAGGIVVVMRVKVLEISAQRTFYIIIGAVHG